MIELEEYKKIKKATIKAEFEQEAERPIVYITSLNAYVDGGRTDLANYEIGKKHNIDFIKDTNGNNHPATTETYDEVITSIEHYGLYLYQKKWELEALIDNCLSIDEVNNIDISF